MKRLIIAHYDEIPVQCAKSVKLDDDREIAVFKLSSGEIRAIDNKCPHKSGKLVDGLVCDHHVYCPLHEWKINLHDGKVQEPETGCVDTFQVEVDEESKAIILITD
jgi:nitrite reductase (NADH) small subunit